MGLISLIRKESERLDLKIRKKIGNGGMSEGVYSAIRINSDYQQKEVAAKFCQASRYPILLDERAVKIFPPQHLSKVYVQYDEEVRDKRDNILQPAQISLYNEERESLTNPEGNTFIHLFDQQAKNYDPQLEYMIQRLVEGRVCIQNLIDAEKKRTPPSSMIVKYEGYQFFTGLGHLNHLLLMEHLEWLSLENLINFEKLSETAVYTIAAQLCDLLDLEDNEVVHLDLKPGNILVNPYSGKIKVLDFDLARSLNGKDHPTSSKDVGPLIRKKSLRKGKLAGTPFYTAPEVVDRFHQELNSEPELVEITTKADIYSVGRIIAEMTGALVHPDSELDNTFRRFTNDDRDDVVNNLAQQEYGYQFLSSVAEMLEESPDQRNYQKGRDFFSRCAPPTYSFLNDSLSVLNGPRKTIVEYTSRNVHAFDETILDLKITPTIPENERN